MEKLINENFFSDEEVLIIKRARNHKSHSSKTTDIRTYKNSTGLEAVIGYLYLENNIARIDEIMKEMEKIEKRMYDTESGISGSDAGQIRERLAV